MERLRHVVGALFFLCWLPAVALAAPSAAGLRLAGAPQGRLLEPAGEKAESRAEVVTFGESLAPGLLRVPLDGEVRVDDWPVAPGERAAVVLTRFDVYAPDARIWKVENGRQTEVPRSNLAFYKGTREDDEGSRIFVAVDPGTRTFSGFSSSPAGVHEIRPLKASRPEALQSGQYLVGPSELVRESEPEPAWTCFQEGATPDFLQQNLEATTTQPLFAPAITSLHTATVAVDTDNEIMNGKFGGSTATATNYIASLFAAMNVIYERDLLVRLLVGTTYLRTGTSDPYAPSSDSTAMLYEFTNYWSSSQGGVTRAIAALLSGRGSGVNGVAWYVNSLCSKSYGYSFNKLNSTGTTPSTGEVYVVAHEIGHNFGSPHTHCYNPPLDNCYNATNCYSGTKTCPAATTINGVQNVRGTLMSYCHLGGIGCTSSNVFHPGSVSLLQPMIQGAVNSCIFPAGGTTPLAPAVSTVSPASGPAAGGTNVTITGANFQSGASVSFGGTASPQVTFNSANQLTARTPARAVGAVTVTVTNPGGQSGSKANAFTFVANSPSISSIGPASGTTAGGTVVTITGANFQNGAVVAFGNVGAPSVTFNSSTRLTVTTPAHATGSVNVTVYNPDSQGGARNPGFFYATPSTATDFYTVTPCRMLDTRNATGTWGGPALGASSQRTFPFINRCGIPATARSVVANLTVTGPTAAGFLTVFPGNAFDLGTTALNYLTGVVRSNNATLRLSTDGAGTVGIRNNGTGTTHVVVDVTGYYVN